MSVAALVITAAVSAFVLGGLIVNELHLNRWRRDVELTPFAGDDPYDLDLVAFDWKVRARKRRTP
jgi:hypothetical protein